MTTERTEMLWDTWGVPHIFAGHGEDLEYAFGWAQMEAHGDLLLRLYGQARGRAAQYWGADFAEGDRLVRTMGVPERAVQWYAAQAPEYRGYLDAFVQGINGYATAHPQRLDAEAKRALPVQPVDVLAHMQRVIHLNFVGARIAPDAGRWAEAGSNAWALGPGKTAGGHAMLLANPHLPWSDFFLFFEAQLVAPGVDAYGVALVGFPVLAIAFNECLGWTHTVNPFDGMDLYELTLEGDGYRWDGGVRPFERATQSIAIRQEDGSLRQEPLTVRRSVHGPVLEEREGKALAVRLTGLDQPHFIEQYWQMMRAANLEQFEAAVARLQNPFFNVIYADRDGHILYLFGGRMPRRAVGELEFWQGIVPGDQPALLWTQTHPYADLPRLVDPPGGWVHNANDPPWTATFPRSLRPEDFPPYMAPRGMSLRAQRSVRLIAAGGAFTFEELIAAKHSTRLELADRVLDELLEAVRQSGGESARRAAEALAAWDRQAQADSRGAVLFAAWVREARSQGELFAQPWSEAAPRTTPAGLRDPQAAVRALEKAAQQVEAAHGALDVPWGEVYRLRYAGQDLPANGGPGDELGIFRVLGFEAEADGRYRAVAGDSYVAAIEFAQPVRAQALLGYGNASQPGSPHCGDQLELFAGQELRPVWRTRAAIEAHLEKREEFSGRADKVEERS